VKAARTKELEFFKSKQVWVKKLKAEARTVTGRQPISVRWVDINKGDDDSPNYRSRLVARQMKALDSSDESFFAPTPPLEGLRTVLSMTTTTIPGVHRPCYDPKSERRVQLSFVDVKRAYFNAKVDPSEPTYVDLPPEDADCQTMCAKLARHMYGTRGAADGWQQEYSSTLVRVLGFEQGLATPCAFYHRKRQLACCVHGDDFTTSGPKCDLDWFETQLTKVYECTVGARVGPGDGDSKEATVLNRVVRWTNDGLELEADPRQAEKLIRECGLEGANSAATPGIRQTKEQVASDKELDPRLHTPFMGSAARANYLSMDRPDLQFGAKEVCRWMSKPTELSWTALKRLCRYLVGVPRLVYCYPKQVATSIDVYSDTDWSGCPISRKSTSGGCVMVGKHIIKSWSSTLASVSLSSGEAEFYGVVRASGVGLGYQSLLNDFGVVMPLRVWTDSTAAVGICSRQGLGSQRHIATHSLWVQQAIRSGRFTLHKVAGETNPADVFTKHMPSRDKLAQLIRLFGCKFASGRAEAAPAMREGAGTKLTMAAYSDLNGCTDEVMVPHLQGDKHVMQEYPPIQPHDDQTVDCDMWISDGLLDRGTAIAREVMREAATEGRIKKGSGMKGNNRN
jgi:histone deacetylase 1/2